MSVIELKRTVSKHSNPEKGKFLQRFFKTAKGEYAEGDIFAGINVPNSRKISEQFKKMSLNDLSKIIKSKIHEERLIALFILVDKMKKGEEKEREKIYKFYLKNIRYVNNWDLVDLSADKIIGEYLFDKKRELLFKLVKGNLWEKRIAVLSSFNFVKKNDYSTTLKICKLLLNDKEDLIHKATGWMLREIGKRDLKAEEDFLKLYYKRMPRTMLRYAVEKFPGRKRKSYLLGRV